MENQYKIKFNKASMSTSSFFLLAATSLSTHACTDIEKVPRGFAFKQNQFINETIIPGNTSMPTADTQVDFKIKIDADEYEKIRGELHQYHLLQKNWDGYGANAPSKNVIECSEQLLDLFDLNEIRPPKVMLSNEGEISFYWENQTKYIELTIEIDGRYSAFIENDINTYDVVDIDMPNKFAKIEENVRIELETI